MQENPYKKWKKLGLSLIWRLPSKLRVYTFRDLINEAFALLADSDEENTDETFAKYINKAFVKLNQGHIRANVNLYKWQLQYIKNWNLKNRDHVNKVRRERYAKNKKPSMPTGKSRGCNKTGKDHPKYVGEYITPFGRFSSTYEFEKATGLSRKTCERKCKDEKYADWNLKRLNPI